MVRLPFESQHLTRWQMWSLNIAVKSMRDSLAAQPDLTTAEKALRDECQRIVDRLAMPED